MFDWKKWLSSGDQRTNPPQPRSDKVQRQTLISVAEPNPYKSAAPGRELSQFLSEMAIVIGEPVSAADLDKSLTDDFGLDELDIAEALIVAEEAFGRATPRQASSPEEFSARRKSLRTMNDVIRFVRAQGS